MKKSISLLLITTFISTLFLTGFTFTKAAQSKATVKDSVVFVSMLASQTLDPLSSVTSDKTVMHQIFDTLVKFKPDYTIAPCVASSWKESADGMSITFKLRKDVTFHDGSKLTAQDVVYSYQKMLTTANGAYYKQNIPKLVMVDNYTIKVTKATNFEKILNVLAEMLYIVPKSVVEKDEKKFATNPIGSGAYKFVKKEADGSIEMVANSKYFLGVPQIKKLTVKPPMDPATSLVALQNGEVDMVWMLPSSQLSQIANNKNIVISKEQGWSLRSMIFPGEPFKSNDKLREAVYHAINPANVFAMGASKDGALAKDLFAKKIMGEYSGVININNRYNPVLAKQLLKESGYDTSKPLTFAADPTTVGVLQVIQGDLKAIGLNVEIQQVDMNTLFNRVLKGDLSVMVADLGTDIQTAEDYLNFFSTQGDVNKMFGKKFPAYDRLMKEIFAEKNQKVRKVLVVQAFKMFEKNSLVVPFYEPNFNIVHSSRISNVHGMGTYVTYVGDYKLK